MTINQDRQMWLDNRVNIVEHIESKGWSQVNVNIKSTSKSFKTEDEIFENINIKEIGDMPISRTFQIIDESDDEIVMEGHYIIAASITGFNDPIEAKPSDYGRCQVTIKKA